MWLQAARLLGANRSASTPVASLGRPSATQQPIPPPLPTLARAGWRQEHTRIGADGAGSARVCSQRRWVDGVGGWNARPPPQAMRTTPFSVCSRGMPRAPDLAEQKGSPS